MEGNAASMGGRHAVIPLVLPLQEHGLHVAGVKLVELVDE